MGFEHGPAPNESADKPKKAKEGAKEQKEQKEKAPEAVIKERLLQKRAEFQKMLNESEDKHKTLKEMSDKIEELVNKNQLVGKIEDAAKLDITNYITWTELQGEEVKTSHYDALFSKNGDKIMVELYSGELGTPPVREWGG